MKYLKLEICEGLEMLEPDDKLNEKSEILSSGWQRRVASDP